MNTNTTQKEFTNTKSNSPHQRADIFGSASTKNEQKRKELITLRGITTSQVNQALKAKNPYPARVFLKIDKSETKLVGQYDPTKRQCYMCLVEISKQEEVWCSPCEAKRLSKDKDIPVIFRVSKLGSWIKPKIPTNSQIEVKGYFDNPKNGSDRPSFTAYSYQILESKSHNQVQEVKKIKHGS